MRATTDAAAEYEPRITAESLDVSRRSLAIIRDVTIRPEVRQHLRGIGRQERLHQLLRTEGRRGIELAARDLIDLANAGASEAELRLFEVFLASVRADCLAERAAPDLAALELAEMEADVAEDLLQPRALLVGETPCERTERAAALRRQAAASLVLARALEADVRRQQLNLHHRRAS